MQKDKIVNKDKKILSFPQMGNYYVPVKYLFKHIFNCEIMSPPKITNKTIELGSKYSPDFVCTPFKYTLGTFIESLEKDFPLCDHGVQMAGIIIYGEQLHNIKDMSIFLAKDIVPYSRIYSIFL